MQESRSVLLFDVRALKNPLTHVPHSGWVVTVPTVFVYLPGGHLVWARQESVWMLLLDVKSLKKPGRHASHVGSVALLPAVLVYLPGEHFLVCAVHHSKGQSVATMGNISTTDVLAPYIVD